MRQNRVGLSGGATRNFLPQSGADIDHAAAARECEGRSEWTGTGRFKARDSDRLCVRVCVCVCVLAKEFFLFLSYCRGGHVRIWPGADTSWRHKSPIDTTGSFRGSDCQVLRYLPLVVFRSRWNTCSGTLAFERLRRLAHFYSDWANVPASCSYPSPAWVPYVISKQARSTTASPQQGNGSHGR